MKRREKRSTRLLLEELEPRILHSADLAVLVSPAALMQAAEIRLVDSSPAVVEGAAAAQTAAVAPRALAIVDSAVPDYQQLVADLEANSKGTLQVFVLDPLIDGVDQISKILAAQHDVQTIHIISHGSAGALQLGAGVLASDTLSQSAAALQGWAGALTPDADILIYGCDVAAGPDGRAFVDALSRLTGADVAASDDLTGNAARGGDWTLEYAAGRIEAAAPFSAAFEQSWQGTLAHVDASVTFAPSVAGTWETHDLSGGAFNVPANAVIEIAISNSDTSAAQTGGVRQSGSALERSFALNRPLTGTTSVEMLVQADANGRIETFASSTTNITYTMLGYWTNGTYVETAGSFSAATDARWESHSLGAYGVTAGAVAEIVITNDSPNSPQVGVRAEGSLLDRYTDIRNRGTGTGGESMTMLVKTGATAAASIEAYAQSDRPNVKFNVVGYWSTAPGTYTEAFTDLGQPGASGAWESKSLAAYGVPAGVVADVLFLNLEPSVGNSAGVREVGGTGARVLALNSYGTTGTAGPDNGRMLAKTSSDTASNLEWFDTDAAASAFYLMGYFQNNAPTLGSAADLTAIAEDPSSNPGNLVSSLFAATDADGDPRGIAVTAADDTHGAWQYSTDGGTAWSAFGTPAAASARLLAPSALVRFVPAPNWNGAAGLTFRAWDQTSGTAGGTADTTANGGATAFSSTTAVSGITVNAVNDAPTVTDRALVFDGTDVVTVAAQPNLVATSTLTVEARVQRTGPLGVDRQIILNKEGEYEISISSTGTLQWAFADTTPGWTWTDTGITVAADTWVDVAVTFNSGVVNAYIDGSLAYTYAGTGNIGDAHPTMNDLTIGGRQNSTGERFIGLIDDVRVWNVERSAAQIQAAHATAPAGNEPGLVGYWRFDESSGTTATDSSTQGYHGVLGNGVAANAPARTTNLDYTTAEDTALAVTAQGVLTRATDPDGTALIATLVTGPAHAAAFTLNPDGSFSYTPTANYNGADSFVFTAGDGSLSSQAATVRLTVTAVNDAPTLSAGTLAAIDEDTGAPSGAAISAIFSGQFSDVDAGSSFSGIAVVGNSASAVTQGVWQYSSNGGTNWFAIGSVADGASARALSASTLLRFVPAAGYNGTPAALTVRGLDDTYAGAFSATAATETPVDVDTTSRGGSTAIASATATVSTSVTSVNDAPAGTATTLTTLEDTAHIFTAADFGFTDLSDSPANALLSVRIATVPGAGTLALSGLAVRAGQSIAVADIDAGNLRFTPAANANGAAYASFTFQVRDDGGTANGGVDLDPVARTLTLDVTAVNDAPVVAGTNDMAGINRNPVSNPGTLVADLVSGHVSDSDAASLNGIAVTGVDNTNGAWQYSTDGGSTWSAFGAPGAATARLLAADVATFVRFVPNANFSGTVANGLTYKAWDETVGVVGGTGDTTASGGASAFSAAAVSASITVTASNTAPSLTGSNNLAPVNEDAAANGGTLVSALIAGFASDADPGALTGIAVTAVDNTNGAWQYSLDSGGSWSAFGTPAASSARLLAADASTYVRFVPNADWNGTVNGGITFSAWDRSTGVAGATADTSGVAGTFRDNFQTASYANNDGTLAWTGSWVETDSQGGGAASGRFEITSGVLVIQAGNVGDNIYREANLSGATGATLSFAYGSNLKGNASLHVQVSNDGGASYTTLAGGVFNASTNTFAGSRSFDITSSIASNTRVRWVVVGSESASDSNLVYVDNIQITASARNGGGTAFSTATAASAITVDPVNDAPVRTAGSVANLAVLEDAAATSLGLSALAYAPGGGADEAAQSLTYTVTALPAAALGTITLNDGTTAVTASTSYTLGQLQGMKFKAAANAAGGPSTFSWTVADSGGTANGGVDILTQSLTVTVTAV
ncbi:MAG: Laminin subdomain protein 2 domain protein, partial [Betaproteobacteria bacterium]|nr:Laminin subdomain protein 2 domain protein [Betaproteobacteria bacterium]